MLICNPRHQHILHLAGPGIGHHVLNSSRDVPLARRIGNTQVLTIIAKKHSRIAALAAVRLAFK